MRKSLSEETMFCKDFDSFVSTLEHKGYVVHPAENAAQAKEFALSLIGAGSVGFGGSATVHGLGLSDTLRAQGNAVYKHWDTPEDRKRVFLGAATADFYVCSTNAITLDGTLVNIDGTGNRVAAIIGGPENVIFIIGKNKLVKTLSAALKRVKTEACPKNARRLNLPTPCAEDGKCSNCDIPQRMCRVTAIIEYPPRMVKAMHLILVDEELGY